MKFNAKIVIVSLVVCALIAIIPLIMIKDSEFGGADGAAGDVITEILGVDEYQPWVEPICEPPGGETESLLFCLQAALGAGIFGYGLGILVERKNKNKNKTKTN